MKKIIMFIAFFAIVSAMSYGQLLVKHIALGAKGIDSIAGGAPSGGTTTYYYLNMRETVAAGKTASTTPITNYKILAVSASISPSVKSSLQPDSSHIWLEVSTDNSTWYKWKNVTSTNYMYQPEVPLTYGSTGTYNVALDAVHVGATAAGGLFIPIGCFFPYARVGITVYKAATYCYPQIYFTLSPVNE